MIHIRAETLKHEVEGLYFLGLMRCRRKTEDVGSRSARGSLFSDEHPGVLDAKVGYFDPKSAKVLPEQIGTKPAKVGHLAATLLKCVPRY